MREAVADEQDIYGIGGSLSHGGALGESRRHHDRGREN